NASASSALALLTVTSSHRTESRSAGATRLREMSPQPMSPHLTFANSFFVFLCLFVAIFFARDRNRASGDRVWMERYQGSRRSCRGASPSARARPKFVAAQLLLTIQSRMELPQREQAPHHHPLPQARHSLTPGQAQPAASLQAEAPKA